MAQANGTRAQGRRLDRALTRMDQKECLLVMMEQGFTPSSDEVLLVSMHKARIERTRIDPRLRLESVEWLRARGFRRRGGVPLPEPGVLPD